MHAHPAHSPSPIFTYKSSPIDVRAIYTLLAHVQCNLHPPYTCTAQPTPSLHAHNTTYTLIAHARWNIVCTCIVQPTPFLHTQCNLHPTCTLTVQTTPCLHAHGVVTPICTHRAQTTALHTCSVQAMPHLHRQCKLPTAYTSTA